MADRKKVIKKAVAESVEFSEMANKPAAVKANKPTPPSEKLKEFRLNPKQQDADAAKPHPSAKRTKPLSATQTHGRSAAKLIEAAQVARVNNAMEIDSNLARKAAAKKSGTPAHLVKTEVAPASLEGMQMAEHKARLAELAKERSKERRKQRQTQAKQAKITRPAKEKYPNLASQVAQSKKKK